MSKISYITNILRESIDFDNELINGNRENVNDLNTKINNDIKQLKFYDSGNNIEKELSKLSYDLQMINDNIIKKINITKKIDEHKNTLIFFYKEGCQISKKFVPDWIKLKAMNNNLTNMISINCLNPKYNNICNLFTITKYPSIIYINKSSVQQYNGELSATNIYNTLLKKV